MTTADYIGTGFSFPMGVDAQGGISMIDGVERIEQSIRLILSTALGERVVRPEFGCGVWDHVFSPVTPPMLGQITAATTEAIKRWEPRAAIVDVTTVADPAEQNRVLIDITYRVAPHNDRRNLVYPFYVLPGGADR